MIADPVNVRVVAGETSHVTVTDATEKRFRIHKQDKQDGFSLEGAVFRFEQIDGSFTTEGRTKSDGIIEFTPDTLPYGSYRVTEITPPEGYEKDESVQTVDWNGTADVDLYFHNVRKMGFDIMKVDADTNTPLEGAVFAVYKDGELITTVRTNAVGIATVSGLSEGYYEVQETVAPDGYLLDSTLYGIHLDPFNPATAENPVLRISNRARPALRIVKYDGQTKQPIPNTTFQVYKDTQLLGEYVTDAKGEIYLYDLEPGTYLVQEIATADTHVVNSTPQEVKLEAGMTEMYSLVFFNYLKPGIRMVKLDRETMQPLANAKFRVTQVGGGFSKEYTSGASGEIVLDGLEPGSYTVEELSAPAGYLIDEFQRIIKIEAGENAEFVFTDTKKPGMKLVKLDSLTGARLAGATFRIAKIEDGSHYLDRVTDVNGEINISDLEPGVYSVQEQAAPTGYVLDQTEYHVELFAGQTSQIVISNDVKPDLRIVKMDADTGAYLPGATFKIKKADGATLTSELTGANGEIFLENVDPGVYEVIEQTPPVGYLPAREASQLVTLEANKLATVIFQNYEKPTLTVNKISSVSGEPLKGAKFRVTYRSNNTETGSMSNLGSFLTGDNGQFHLDNLNEGWYTVTELESVAGYTIKEPATQEVYIKGGEDKVLTFENTPLSALIVYKYDTVTGEAVTGAVFSVKKMSDTSGTGGTVIGQYKTGPNGSFTVTGLREGTYIVEELASDSGHVIDTAPQTVYVSGKEQDVVEVFFGNTPKGAVLVKKIDNCSGEPLAGVQFYVTQSDGSIVGNGNGYFTTDSAGAILIDGLDPGVTLVIKETRALAGYVLDNVPQTVHVKAGQTVSLEFRNARTGSVLIKKLDAVTHAPLSDVQFYVTDSEGTALGSSNGLFTTDAAGTILIDELKPCTTVIARETTAKPGYILDDTAQTVKVKSGKTVTMEFRNQPKGSLIITKRDSVTGAPLQGVTFTVTTSSGEFVGNEEGRVTSNGEYVTDASGQIALNGLSPGTYIVTETATISGYVLDSRPHSIVVNAGDAQTLTLTNQPKGALLVKKVDSVTKLPLAGAEFRITTADGALVDDNEGLTSSSGIYVTDENGEIFLSKLTPATYIITETKAPEGYKLNAQARTVVVRAANTHTVTINDDPLCTLTVTKRDAVTKKPLANAEFIVQYSDGRLIGPNGGRYTTNSNGTVTVTGMTPDATVIVTEDRAPTGYIKDSTPQSIVVRTGVANALVFDDEPTTTLIIRKFINGTDNEPLANVAFKVIDGSGKTVGPDDGVYYTDEAGEIVLSDLEPGITVKVREIRTVEGFVLDGIAQDIEIREREVQQLTFWNKRQGNLVIRKLDSVTKQPLAGVEFKVVYANGKAVDTAYGALSSEGIYTTDANGEITINGVVGTVVITEEKTIPGYSIDPAGKSKVVTVRAEDTQTIEFYNDPLQTLTIQKYAAGTQTPLQGVQFLVTDSAGQVVGNSNGEYITDKNGRIVISGLTPGTTITAKETQTVSGYVLDENPQSIKITEGEAQYLTFYNSPKGGLVVQKLDSNTKKPLAGAEFKITTVTGEYVDDNEGRTYTKGIYWTDANGQIVLSKLQPGTYVVTETKAPEGYTLDAKPQTVQVNANDRQTLYFYNTPIGGVEILKVSEADRTQRIANTTFEIRKLDDGLAATVTTDKNGRAFVSLEDGSYYAVETMAAKGFQADTTPTYFEVKNGKTTTLTITNKPFSGILLHKLDASTGKGIYGVTFLLYDSGKNPIGQYSTDNEGYIRIEALDAGRYYLKELENPGYVVDSQLKIVVVKAGETTEIEWKNTAITGQIQITKTSADYNSVNGWPEGAPIPDTYFEIYNKAGVLMDTVRTDRNGVASSKPLPLGRYKIIESKAAMYYALDTTPIEVEIEFSGQIVRAAMTNKSLYTNVSIKKTGYSEAMPGQSIAYTLTNIGNNSNASLTSFYWRDTLPVQAVRLDKIVTGTWNARGNYKIVYRTNNSGENWRTLSDNLSTSKNYVLDASATALGLAAGEYVTEFMFSFGTVPANFKQVESPKVTCTTLPTLISGTQFTNQADVGGVYGGQWIMATSRWTTTIYAPSKPLPRTGY